MTNGTNQKEANNQVVKKRIEEMIEALKGWKVTILGHDNIDVDATLSGILLSKLLNFLGISNEFCILETVKENETYRIIQEVIGIDMKDWQKEGERTNRKLFLVDHYETFHKGEVVACLDHHPTNQKKEYPFYYVRKSCATAYLIYEMMEEVNYPLTKEEATMIVVAMMVDTTVFRSTKTVANEIEQAKKIAKEYQLDYTSLEKCSLCLTPIQEMTTEEIISNGQKWYQYEGKKVGSSYLQLEELPEEEQVKEWLRALKRRRAETESDMLVFLIFESNHSKTYEYQITEDCIKEMEKDNILSRGQDIMPLVEKRYLDRKNTEEKMEVMVQRLAKEHNTIATMESCTGGELASQITNVSGASEVLMESYVSYCNGAKIKFGVPEYVIHRYSVYSAETATAMARVVRKMAYADIGVGITGQLGRVDPHNTGRVNNTAWYAINKEGNTMVRKLTIAEEKTRAEKKEVIIREIVEDLYHLC